MGQKFTIIPGNVFGRLTVLDLIQNRKTTYGHRIWRCQCACGAFREVSTNNLRSGNVKSCGCIAKETTVHRSTVHGLYGISRCLGHIYKAIVDRCINPKNKNYYNYGQRGIGICKEWIDHPGLFGKWALNNGWRKGLEIDRIDNGGDYCPENCRVVTRKQNARNKRTNRLITINSKTKPLVDWCEEYNMPYNTVWKRLRLGWGIERALVTPIKNR
jgi:hypothetical protein